MKQLKNFSINLADNIASFLGSWNFIIIQSSILLIWIFINVDKIVNFDPYPFILLNLFLSFEAAYATPLILMSSNRQSERDREHLIKDVALDEETNIVIKKLVEEMTGEELYLMSVLNNNNPEKFKYYTELSTEKNNSDGINSLALYYELQEKNYEKAIELYEKAIQMGNVLSMRNLGDYYASNGDIENKIKESIKDSLKDIKIDSYVYENINSLIKNHIDNIKNLHAPQSENLENIDDNTWERGRGWALSIALIMLPYYKNSNPVLATLARRIIEHAL